MHTHKHISIMPYIVSRVCDRDRDRCFDCVYACFWCAYIRIYFGDDTPCLSETRRRLCLVTSACTARGRACCQCWRNVCFVNKCRACGVHAFEEHATHNYDRFKRPPLRDPNYVHRNNRISSPCCPFDPPVPRTSLASSTACSSTI